MNKDVLVRALKTFWQSAIAYLLATFSTQMVGVDVFDLEAMQKKIKAVGFDAFIVKE